MKRQYLMIFFFLMHHKNYTRKCKQVIISDALSDLKKMDVIYRTAAGSLALEDNENDFSKIIFLTFPLFFTLFLSDGEELVFVPKTSIW